MATTVLSPTAVQKFFDNNGLPLASGKLFSFQAGTNTPAATYTDQTGVTPNTNPIILNARGECGLWIPPNTAFKFQLQDSLGNTIWTVDQVTNAQLLTLYGGTDTGVSNAYVLNYTASFTALTNGIVVYWTPANSNSGASTLNVNGLGAIGIVNPDGSSLSTGEIVANNVVATIYLNGFWVMILTSATIPLQGSFTVTATGGTFTPAASTAVYSKNGPTVTLFIPNMPGVSNSTSFTYTGLPASLQPNRPVTVPIAIAMNNSAFIAGAYASMNAGTGTITFGFLGSETSWTATGNKQVGKFSSPFFFGVLVTYSLI